MIEITIPGDRDYQLHYLILDYNGTLAVDGYLIEGVMQRLSALSAKIDIHVITADTFGRARAGLKGLSCTLSILVSDNQTEKKAEYIQKLGLEKVICIGNGSNDSQMIKKACLGIAVMQAEGISSESLQSADIVCCSILDALDLLLHPKWLIAVKRR
ncbi:MAG: HAD hydrolase family protein [bacterium]